MKILLIDNHTLFREGLRHIMQHLPGGVKEVLEAGNFQHGLKLASQHPCLDLVLLELKTPGCNGAMAVKFFRSRYPHIPLVVVSSETDHLIVNKALGYGALGFVCKTLPSSAFLNTLTLVLSGHIYVPPQTAQKADAAFSGKDVQHRERRSNANEHGLTLRQMDILRHLVAGLSNKEIAGAINLSEGTVKTHVAAIYQTLRVDNRMDAMRMAETFGLVGAPVPPQRMSPAIAGSCRVDQR